MTESTSATTRARALERVREITLQVLGDRDVRVYLFGSSVTGRLRRSSDIDVAIDPVRALPSALLAELRERLVESAVPYDVDIIDLSLASPELRFAYTFEAVYKAAQLYLQECEGLDVGSPKQSVRSSRGIGLLTDEQSEAALSMTGDRNLVVHVYREAVASDLDRRLHLHAATLAAWLGAMSP